MGNTETVNNIPSFLLLSMSNTWVTSNISTSQLDRIKDYGLKDWQLQNVVKNIEDTFSTGTLNGVAQFGSSLSVTMENDEICTENDSAKLCCDLNNKVCSRTGIPSIGNGLQSINNAGRRRLVHTKCFRRTDFDDMGDVIPLQKHSCLDWFGRRRHQCVHNVSRSHFFLPLNPCITTVDVIPIGITQAGGEPVEEEADHANHIGEEPVEEEADQDGHHDGHHEERRRLQVEECDQLLVEVKEHDYDVGDIVRFSSIHGGECKNVDNAATTDQFIVMAGTTGTSIKLKFNSNSWCSNGGNYIGLNNNCKIVKEVLCSNADFVNEYGAAILSYNNGDLDEAQFNQRINDECTQYVCQEEHDYFMGKTSCGDYDDIYEQTNSPVFGDVNVTVDNRQACNDAVINIWGKSVRWCRPKEKKHVCHPADSVVRVQHPCDAGTCVSPRRMDELNIGDMSESTPGVFEPIIAFSHRDSDSSANYYEFVADNRTVLHISKGHYLYVNEKLTLPKDVCLGDTLSTGETVTDIQRQFKKGLFHPHTWSAKLVVDGVQTSCNTEFIEVSIQDYVTTPFWYVCYKMGVPVDMIPTSRIYKGGSNAKLVSSWFDGLRPYLSPPLEIFIGACVVPVLLCWTFPEVLAVAAMGYYVYKQNKNIKN
jgi:hypothetical protein